MLESCAHRRMHSDVDTFDLVERDLFGQAIIELRGAGGLVPRDPGGDLEVAAVSQVLRDPGAAEAVGADLAGEPHLSDAALDHLERAQTRHRPILERNAPPRLAAPEQRSAAVFADAGGDDPRTGELLGTWIFVMTLAWSRHGYAEVVTDQKVATWLGCHRRAFEWFNGVPARLTIDNPKCAITRACYHDPEVQRA